MATRKLRAAVVASAGRVTGIVGEEILVLPNMSPRHQIAFMYSRACVAEVGGPLAHLAIVSREMGRTLMVMSNACELLLPGMRVTLDPGRCTVEVHEDSV